MIDNSTITKDTAISPVIHSSSSKKSKHESDPIKYSATKALSDVSKSDTYKKMAHDAVNKKTFNIYDLIKNPDEKYHYRLANIKSLNEYGFTRSRLGYEFCKSEERVAGLLDSPDGLIRVGDLVLVRRPKELHNYILDEKHKRNNEMIRLFKSVSKTKKMVMNNEEIDVDVASIKNYQNKELTDRL